MATCTEYGSHRAARAFGLVAALTCLIASVGIPSVSFGQATSSWVYYDKGKLRYATDDVGNRIIDYSWAGYRGGGVALPKVPARITVTPTGGDDTAAIQSAIDTVSARQPDRKGFRGAVLLAPGSFNVSATLQLTTSGVVLTGSGSDANGTVLTMVGSTPFTLLAVGGSGTYTRGPAVSMVDTYVPSGARSFNVSDASGFKAGDNILVSRPVTEAWVAFMGMDKLVRNGLPQTWIAAGSEILTDRSITAVKGNRIFIDAPLTDSFDAQYLGPTVGSVATYTFDGRISQVGVEHLAVVAPAQVPAGALYSAVNMNNVLNGWLRDVRTQDTQNSISLSNNTKRVTLESVHVVHTYRQAASGAPADFALSGTELLANNCSVTGQGNTWPFVSHARVTGPIVILKAYADDRGYAPHQRWATGLLCDLCNFPNSYTGDKTGIGYTNRGYFGSGHGWDAGFAVAWNVTSTYFLIQEPPGAHNWCIGCVGTALSDDAPGGDGTILPNGIYESLGSPVTPGSLYLAQLKQRLGTSALRNIGYADTDGTPLEECD